MRSVKDAFSHCAVQCFPAHLPSFILVAVWPEYVSLFCQGLSNPFALKWQSQTSPACKAFWWANVSGSDIAIEGRRMNYIRIKAIGSDFSPRQIKHWIPMMLWECTGRSLSLFFPVIVSSRLSCVGEVTDSAWNLLGSSSISLGRLFLLAYCQSLPLTQRNSKARSLYIRLSMNLGIFDIVMEVYIVSSA